MAVPPSKTQRTCSQCGNNGHNARTCIDTSGGSTGFMLFGVRLTAAEGLPTSPPMLSAFRKTVSMSNLSQYEHQPQGSSGNVAADVDASGYASDDAIHASGSRRNERKRGTPWTEEEHKLFLMGLKKVGKGDWRGISKNFVKTRTPTQVASHAQKYFIRRSNVSRRRRRSSLFDITTDAVATLPIEEQSLNQDSASKSILFPKPTNLKQSCPVPPSAKMANLNLNQSPSPSSSSSTTSTRERELEPVLSLKLPSDEGSVPRASVFREFNSNGDSIISVA